MACYDSTNLQNIIQFIVLYQCSLRCIIYALSRYDYFVFLHSVQLIPLQYFVMLCNIVTEWYYMMHDVNRGV